jgi:hypothetical protein
MKILLLLSLLAGFCRPDGTCTACKDCSRCAWCSSGKGSCSVCQHHTGDQQRARDAKRKPRP